MTRYYAGPWQWNSSESNPHYHAPAGSSALIDLRNMETQSATNHSAGVGNGFFCTPDDVSLPSEYALLGQGYITEVATNNAVKSAWQSLYGVVPQGDKLIDYLSYTLGDGSDSDGDTAPKPIMPGVSPQNEVQIVLTGHSVVYRRTMNFINGTSEHAKKCRERIRKDLAGIADVDDKLFRKCLGRMKEKFGLAWDAPQEDWALNAKTKGRRKGSNGKTIAEKPATTASEAWSGSDGAITSGRDQTWTFLTGGSFGSRLEVVSNQLRTKTTTGVTAARCGVALSGSDTYAQEVQTSIETDFSQCGAIVRKDSSDSTLTFYRVEVMQSSGTTYISGYKYVAGTETWLGDTAFTWAANDVIKTEINGSSLKGYQNGVQRRSNTDTAISSGTYCGVFKIGYGSVGGNPGCIITDDFACGDLGGGGGVVIPVFMNQYRQRWGK